MNDPQQRRRTCSAAFVYPKTCRIVCAAVSIAVAVPEIFQFPVCKIGLNEDKSGLDDDRCRRRTCSAVSCNPGCHGTSFETMQISITVRETIALTVSDGHVVVLFVRCRGMYA